MKKFYERYAGHNEKVQRSVALLPWSHNMLLLSKGLDDDATLYYATKTVEKGWNRDLLLNAIKLKMYETQALARVDNNFGRTLPAEQAQYANEVFNSSYNLGFLGVTSPILELELEDRLVKAITRFLMELGNGFTFIGNQHVLEYNGKESKVDMLFFHRGLRCLVAVDLKIGAFKPEYAGKMNYYLSLLDRLERGADENRSIGIILCAEKDRVEVELALEDMGKPIGVADYQLIVPKEKLQEVLADEIKAFSEEKRNNQGNNMDYKVQKNSQNNDMTSLVNDVCNIIETGRKEAYVAAGKSAVITYWNIGRRIVKEEQQGKERAEYGAEVIKNLALKIIPRYGASYNKRNLDYYKRFYLLFPDIQIVNTCVHNLSWSHIRRILSVSDPNARLWYLRTADKDMWSFRALDRNISTQYYERRLAAQREKSALPVDMENSTDPLEYIKNPMMAEFMGFHRDADYNESDFEKALIDNLEKFIMELGRGFAFVERQQHIVTDTDDFYIDLVFYNYRMKRFVIFELKTHKLTHQDIGQLDMYVRMYDDLIKGADDAPTIGVLLCTDTDNTIARYSVLHDNNQLFAAKYMTYMPTEEELRNEIEQQKRFFMEQHGSHHL